MQRSLCTLIPFVALTFAGCEAGDEFGIAGGPADLLTRAERSDYLETSRHAEVIEFLETVVRMDDRMSLTTFGFTNEARAIPLVTVAQGLADRSPAAIRENGKLVLYLQGNIHGGEVEGKEALQILLREIASGQHDSWFNDMILLVAPVYNADGNDAVGLNNRPGQNGPAGGMGQRPNAQGLDLNRDHIKLNSPEARSVARLVGDYAPHVTMDLHTTNGTNHAYFVTYSPPLHPNTDPAIISLLRDRLLPDVTETIRDKHGMNFYYYGNAGGGGAAGGGAPGGQANLPRWSTFDSRPRFNNNYLGLRNRIAILSEAFAYASFEDRIAATLYFVQETVDWAEAHTGEIRAAVEIAETRPLVGTQLSVRNRITLTHPEPVDILMGAVETRYNAAGRPYNHRLDVLTPTPMWEYGSFESTEDETVPAAYIIPPVQQLQPVLDRLESHGVPMRTLNASRTMIVESFRIDSTSVAAQPFQSVNERTLWGAWVEGEQEIPARTIIISMDGPHARLAFYLLEPRADDGFTDWAILDRWIDGDGAFPILRSHTPIL
ncbi:MAG: M14 family metallopeptidase [Gemmatimonadota bacterium]|nr:M14 family metallopeptidase [Gemmatimonadota bacterium]